MLAAPAEREVLVRYPIRGTFVGCCASADRAVVRRIVASSQIRIFAVMNLCSYCCLLLVPAAYCRIASSTKLLSKDCFTSYCFALGWSTNFNALAIAFSMTLSELGKASL